MREAQLPGDKVLVVSNGVDPNLFDPCRQNPFRFFEGFTIGYAGSLIAWQGLDLLLKAMHGLEAGGVQMHLVVIGEGIMRTSWEALARELGLAARVRFLGRIPQAQVPGVIGGCDVGFTGHIPGRHGSVYHSPLKLYEYLAMSKPVVASASEDALAVVREGENGFLYQPGDLAGLTRALSRAWAARDSLPAMGLGARTEIIAHHTWRNRAEAICRGVGAILEKSQM
jgi:glycosyltransferase involved in cell wall biosynthesis